ncbi:MAG: FG-GAP-like repeat-containing protein, partial [Candidatus Binatia bacterium]
FGITQSTPPAALRDQGIAELENERPAIAEQAFRQLVESKSDDPLAHANLAIALLRQQKYDDARASVAVAIEKAPKRADVLWIAADIEAAAGESERALESYARAADAAPDDPEVQFALLRQARTMQGDRAPKLVQHALERLSKLRPENLVVLLERGRRALEQKDRAGTAAAYLRIKELSWNLSDAGVTVLSRLLAALDEGNLDKARVPALQLENVFKVTAAYQRSLTELSLGIQGKPIARFAEEPPPGEFGAPIDVRFRGKRLASSAVAGRALLAVDVTGDDRAEIVRVRAGKQPALRVRNGVGTKVIHTLPVPDVRGLIAADLDNDGRLDLVGYGEKAVIALTGNANGGFEDATKRFGLDGKGAVAAVAFDFDGEGDLDVALARPKGGGLELLRNPLSGPLEPVGARAYPKLAIGDVHQLVASDLDRDGDLDLLVVHTKGLTWLANLRQGEFADRTREIGLSGIDGAKAAVAGDWDGDGALDLVVAGRRGLSAWRNRAGRFERWDVGLPQQGAYTSVLALDADNDGRLDLAALGEKGVAVFGQRPGPAFGALAVERAPTGATTIAAADVDHDGDLDLVTGGSGGVHRLENLGGNGNGWLSVRLRGLVDGNSKNNVFGLGATLEVRAGGAYQLREVTEPVTHVGLGRHREADSLRVVWTNGVPQNRLKVAGSQRIVEEQMLKGSCPFLYAWNGERFAFVTDLLWGAPLGLPVAEGAYAGSFPEELVRVDGVSDAGGVVRLRITEELWEAAYFDLVRLWIVDHPEDVEVASNLRIAPQRAIAPRVLASRDVRPVVAAEDGEGRDVTSRVVLRDEVYADGFERSPYQGVAARPWTFTFDLGAAPATPIRLHLDGWIFPADASLNLAVDQRRDLDLRPPRLEVEVEGEWRTLMTELGHPAGKTKTMIVDTPPLPPGSRRLRIVSSLWLAWDRIAWSAAPDDGAAVVRARLEPARAELRHRGFSAPVRLAPNAPHSFDYQSVATAPRWLPFPGRYARYGDVRELVREADDRLVVMAAGDEIALEYDVSAIAPLREGWRRSVFLESHGWDKDADRNTYAAESAEPLPFRAMSGYPSTGGDSPPNDERYRDYLREWLTREVTAR